MFPARVVPFLLLGLTGPSVAQTASPIAWTLASGDYTIFGHTDYTPTVAIIPRIVYDSAPGLDSARVVDSVAPTRNRIAGFAAGLNAWPESLYCGGPTSATAQPLEPRQVLARIQLAARCGVRLVLVPPRKLLTADGQPAGLFSVDSAKRATDRYAAVLPADTLLKYRTTLIGLNLADDYNCLECWGGQPITHAQVAAWAAYARGTLPGLPLGVRIEPDWVAQRPTLAPLLDYAWAQYHTKKGEPRAYYDRAAATAARLGLRVIMGINVENCHGGRTDPCTADELARFGTLAVSHPASCAFLNWRYEEATWQRPEIRAAWEGLLALARARVATGCGRGVEGV